MRTTRVIALTVLLLALPLVGGCATKTNAATGQRQFDSLSREQEIAMGEASMPELIQAYGGAVPSAGAQQYVTDIGRRMSALTEADYPSLPWEFTFLNSDVINAFALPGGKVFVTRGLVERMTNEAQLAGVIGHEIGHVTAEHIDDQLTKQRSIQIAGVIAAIGVGIAAGQDNAAVGAAAGGAILTGAGLYSLTFGRDDELEADELGMRYMTRAGYHPRGMRQLMEILAEASSGA
ncbi:MAG: M48 family metalloprotease, partial [Planctomycetota bacterium]